LNPHSFPPPFFGWGSPAFGVSPWLVLFYVPGVFSFTGSVGVEPSPLHSASGLHRARRAFHCFKVLCPENFFDPLLGAPLGDSFVGRQGPRGVLAPPFLCRVVGQSNQGVGSPFWPNPFVLHGDRCSPATLEFLGQAKTRLSPKRTFSLRKNLSADLSPGS